MFSTLQELFSQLMSDIPPEVSAIILVNLYNSIEETNRKLLKDVIEQLNNEIRMTIEKQQLNPSFFDRNGVRCTIKMGEYVEDNTPLQSLLTSITNLANTYNEEIATKVLKHCFIEAKCDTSNIGKIIDYAATEENVAVCKLFYKTFRADVLLHPNNYGWNTLHRAADKNNVKAVKTLLATVEENEVWDYITIPGANMKESALFRAALTGANDVIQLLLEKAGEQACQYIMNDDNNRHCSLFDGACMNGHLDVVKTLVNAVGPENLWQLIHLHDENAFISACGNGQAEIVDYLLEAIGERKMELILDGSKTGLDYAAFNRKPEVVKVIIKHAAERVNELNLHRAILQTHMNKNVEIAEYLTTFFPKK